MKTKVLMVCLGNICRSPLAEGILRSKVDQTSILVDSAGTAGYHIGNPPDKRSILVAQKHGINISHQRSRQFSTSDFKDFDLIFAMDTSNFRNILRLATSTDDEKKVKLLLDEVDLDTNEVPDPYYGGTEGFERVYEMLDKACEAVAKKLN
ncbi:low molecular weight protein-tyrosine-phosphatase [Flagellimonas flava]|uniref:protein-tyrosine-phosphatase n=1 Tax=Flagellimonas flava TaxID=570519 RepID=A0A1M5I8F9_9FLAO|nr:low molecular weight protein-tyrosine-phosphatase [Allomuricauda flava]SHG24624.1 protein tyrosine phosphatase [Allomuricauda flava]